MLLLVLVSKLKHITCHLWGQGVRLVFSEQQEMQHQDGIMAFLGVCRETRMVQESMEQSHTMRMEWILGGDMRASSMDQLRLLGIFM